MVIIVGVLGFESGGVIPCRIHYPLRPNTSATAPALPAPARARRVRWTDGRGGSISREPRGRRPPRSENPPRPAACTPWGSSVPFLSCHLVHRGVIVFHLD